jgi:alpha-tubulin suppressor-like RCC1 family protein
MRFRIQHLLASSALSLLGCSNDVAPPRYETEDCGGFGCDAPIVPTPDPPGMSAEASQSMDGPITPDPGLCASGETECLSGSSTRYRLCSAEGTWSAPRDCGADQACVDSACGGDCRPGQTRCASSSDVQACDERGAWGESTECAFGCDAGSCRNECSEGQTRCANERDVQICSNDEQYGSLVACPLACDRQTDACGGDCTPGDVECAGATPRRCDQRGAWQDEAACEHLCIAGNCVGECDPGESTTCGVLQNSQGDCRARPLTCQTNGFWPQNLCEPTSPEICDASGRDENCDGRVNEEPPCTSGFTAVSAGPGYACAVTTAGTVSCWGGNGFGNLGVGNESGPRSTPVTVPGVSAAVSVSTGVFGTCAVLNDGSARCWGSIGNGNGSAARLVLSDIEALALGETNTCALLRDRTVRCGNAGPGPLALLDVVNDDAGNDLGAVESIDTQGDTFFCALMRDGSARCWGFGGGFPGASAEFSPNEAERIAGIEGGRQVVAGQGHACALTNAGVLCWGDNSVGQLGVDPGQLFDSATPLAVDVGANVTAIDAGDNFTCALLTNGRVRCWGLLGQEVTPAPREIGGLTQVTALSVGADAACVVRSDRTAACFGDNRQGQLGDGSSTGDSVFDAEFLAPVRVLGP